MVVGIHADLVVAGESIHETEEFMASCGIYYEVDSWQRETIFWACSVDVSEVDAESPLAVRFFEEYDVGQPFRVLRPYRLSVPLFSLWVEELPFLDMRASSPFMYFSALSSTSAMFACGFLEMENIKSFDYTPNPAMNAVMANFSYGISTFKDSALNLWK